MSVKKHQYQKQNVLEKILFEKSLIKNKKFHRENFNRKKIQIDLNRN